MHQHPTDTDGTTRDLIAAGLAAEPASPFALPTGFKGRLAGWYMGFPDAQHRELAERPLLTAGARLLEIGFGPGQLLRMFHRREPGLARCGVDPSELMVARARRRNPRADLRLAAAAALPFPDAHAAIVVAVNNIPMWPDLDAGLAQISRVLEPHGALLVAWHGGHDPRGHQKQLVMAPERKAAIDAAIGRHFPTVRMTTLQHSEIWEATAPPR